MMSRGAVRHDHRQYDPTPPFKNFTPRIDRQLVSSSRELDVN
jgi:hypothetical protein